MLLDLKNWTRVRAPKPPFYKTPLFGVQETVLLVNHALARGTPAIFVIFVVSWGSSSKALVLLVRMQIRHFRHFRQKPPFSGGTKARFTKSTVFGTPTFCFLLNDEPQSFALCPSSLRWLPATFHPPGEILCLEANGT